jgi:hypothetical protein
VLPFIAVLVPLGFQLRSVRLRRGDRAWTISSPFVGTILAVVFGIMATIYVQVYWASGTARQRGAFEVAAGLGDLLMINVALTFAARELGARSSSGAGAPASASNGF